MVKKIAIAALGVVVACAFLSHTKFGSYVNTACDKVRNSANKAVPIEFEIARLRNEINQLTPDIKKNRSLQAEMMEAVESLRNEVATVRANIEQKKASMAKVTQDLENGETEFILHGRKFGRADVAARLTQDLESCKRAEEALKSKEQILDAKEQSLEKIRARIDSMKEQQGLLQAQLAQLETELASVRLAETRNKVEVDDSRLGTIKRDLADLAKRVKIEKNRAELEAQDNQEVFTTGNDTKTPQTVNDVTRAAREYLGGSPNVASDKK